MQIDVKAPHNATARPDLAVRSNTQDLTERLEASERSNTALRAHVQDLLDVVLKLNHSVAVWQRISGFFAIALIAVVVSALFIY